MCKASARDLKVADGSRSNRTSTYSKANDFSSAVYLKPLDEEVGSSLGGVGDWRAGNEVLFGLGFGTEGWKSFVVGRCFGIAARERYCR
jgi:hypothetical protein